MWRCGKCQEQVEDNFEVCWKCGTSKDGVEGPTFDSSAQERFVDADGKPLGANMQCLRCHRKLGYVGTKEFHEGTRWGILGDIGELFVNKEKFDVYSCGYCGHVEFFLNGIGEQFRPH